MTRTPESRIKEGILHPEEELRWYALAYFSKARCEDESIMPLVIRSVEMFGLETAKEVLHEAQQLPQTEATVDWIINQFRRDYDWSDVRQENYCFVLAWVMGKTPPAIFTKRFHDIFTAPAFPEVLRNAAFRTARYLHLGLGPRMVGVGVLGHGQHARRDAVLDGLGSCGGGGVGAAPRGGGRCCRSCKGNTATRTPA